MLTDTHHKWIADTFGVDPGTYAPPPGKAPIKPAGVRPDGPDHGQPDGPDAGQTSKPNVDNGDGGGGRTGMVDPDLPKRAKFSPPPQSRQPTLRKGDESPDGWVEYMQELLKITVSGKFDAATDKAVRAFQASHGCQVDGVVGNETWSVLRHETKEKVGTDGRDPHSFEEKGLEARWFLEDKFALYSKSDDSVSFSVESVGDEADISKHKATFRITPPGASDGAVVDLEIGPAVEKSPTGEGNRHVITIKQFKATYPAEGDQQGPWKVEAYLDAELGGDRWNGDVVDKAPAPPPQPKPKPKPPSQHDDPPVGPVIHPPLDLPPITPTQPDDPPLKPIFALGDILKKMVSLAGQLVKEWMALQFAMTKCEGVLIWECRGESFSAGKSIASVIADIPGIVELLTADAAGVADGGLTDLATIPATIIKVASAIQDVLSAISDVKTMIDCMQKAAGDDPDAQAAVGDLSKHINNIVNLVGQLQGELGKLKDVRAL